MRLHVDNYQRILTEKCLSDDYVRKAVGLSEKRYEFVLESGFAELETLEFIADAIGCSVNEISRPDYEGYSENVIEWVKDKKRATLSLSQRRTISRVKQLAMDHPDECQIVAENKDGSVCAHMLVSWIRINPGIELTEEQKEKKAETMRRNVMKHK